MNYELSEEIIKVLDDLAKRFGVAIDWTDKNVIPYLMDLYDRFITYKIVINIIPIVLFIIFSIITIIFIMKYYKYKNMGLENLESNIFVDIWGYNCI